MTSQADRRILFIDMNSFFASVEQAEDKKLWHKPVIVVPTEGSCALSASYEAKAYGIRTGTLEREARFLCPYVTAIKARPKLYMDYHYRLTAILENLSPRVTMRSVDEGSIELCSNEEPWQLAKEIKEQIYQELGPVVSCSIGIGPNIFLAKLATELEKPDGLVEIQLADLPNIYRKVGLRDLCGINFAYERRLRAIGVTSPFDFYHADAAYLRQVFGVIGYRWWLKLHGYEINETFGGRKSVSHSHVLPPAYRSPQAAYVTLQRLGTKVGRRLRKEGRMARWIGLFIRFTDRTGFGGHLQTRPFSDTTTLLHHLQRLWEKARPTTSILKLAVWTTNLVAAQSIPLPLFTEEQKSYRLSRAIDTINDRYGADTVRFAIIDTKGSKAPDRISFTAMFEIEFE